MRRTGGGIGLPLASEFQGHGESIHEQRQARLVRGFAAAAAVGAAQ